MQEDLLKEINKLIKLENGRSVGLGDTLKRSGVDSFGYMMVLMELDAKYGGLGIDVLAKMDVNTTTLGDVLDALQNV